MPLAIEPLHPMYAADRACVNTLEQALDLCEELDPTRPRRGAGHLHRASPQRRPRRAAPGRQPTAWTRGAAFVARAGVAAAAAPYSISPESWPPSSITTLP